MLRYRRGNQNQETEEGQTCNVRLYVVINVLMCDWVCFFFDGRRYLLAVYCFYIHVTFALQWENEGSLVAD